MKPYLPNKKALVFIADAHIDGKTVISPPDISVLPQGVRRPADLGICIVSTTQATVHIMLV